MSIFTYWMIAGVPSGIAFVLWRTWGLDIRAAWKLFGVCLGTLAGCLFGPVMLLLFIEVLDVDKRQT